MLISVIIPTYNRADILPITIQCVLDQTFQDFELIIVDNGSTDNTKEIVQSYTKKDSRISYYWQDNSGSPAGSRNTGIKKAIGEWISFLDSDDLWTKEKLEEVVKVLRKNDSDNLVGISNYEYKYIDGKKAGLLEHGIDKNEDVYHHLLFSGNCLSTSAMTVRRTAAESVGLFDERKDYFAVEDYDLWMKLAKIGKFYYIRKSLGIFNISSSNMSGNIELINNNLKQLITDHITSFSFNREKEKKLLRIHRSRIEYYKGRAYLLSGDFIQSRKIFMSSIKEYPFNLKKIISLLFSIMRVQK